ncbi:hypothetical protein [Brochothrix thermosphacta]|uniref:Uncharacterized protein n=1 Tax=Brochothrix thermosphacta TaxID=2756 RepID=A0A2X0Q893_BROTH|nr:hypothetical protein [Brochothrix thermosphacta]SLM94216.1 hypothetical protein FM106_07700 [Brachybacterium faecium]ANZ94214.1 hypothetical protein BFC19_01580 [Brochothrix thermosphacta]EUJ37692.1 hypothetical protein BTHER_03979 [Brochothrix thermosphacta DSM 20171 = FSL F6-1036]MDO7862852.1 hypothetical protein [Brochothrix thermosphacta]ODJ48815.1 hypothetical protein BFR34_08045 [Brochothrix thermosphacta DSM 20171 = FSL F6-1036]
MKDIWLGAITMGSVTMSGEIFFTIPTENPQRIIFFVGEGIVMLIIYFSLTAIIDKIKKKNS